MKRNLLAALLMTAAASVSVAADGELRVAALGPLALDSGEVLADCRVGYRTWGAIADDRSNVVVLTTWFAGDSGGLASLVGDGKMFDSSRFHVIAIDALADGVSSSPSNSAHAPGASFPRITIGDMVRAQHALLTRYFRLPHVHAIAGLSMGGMQVFEWVLAHPEFTDLAIPIAGTPRQTAHDLLLWTTQLAILERGGGDRERLRQAMQVAARLNLMEIRTPEWIVGRIAPGDLAKAVASQEEGVLRRDPYDYAAQLRAMIDHDVYRRVDGSVEAAAKAIRAKMLVVVASRDQMVRPEPAEELARATGSELLVLTGDCGHLATACESEVLAAAVRGFLDRIHR